MAQRQRQNMAENDRSVSEAHGKLETEIKKAHLMEEAITIKGLALAQSE